LPQANLRLTAKARVTAGLMWAPLTPPATHTAMATAKAHPHAISSQSPAARKIVVGVWARPEPGRAATAMATTPSPNAIKTKHPRNSAIISPYKPVIRPTVRPSPRKGVISDIINLPTVPVCSDINRKRPLQAIYIISPTWFIEISPPLRLSFGPEDDSNDD